MDLRRTFLLNIHATRPLSRYYLRSYLVKNTGGAYKESAARNTRAILKSKLRVMPDKTRVLHEYNTKESLTHS